MNSVKILKERISQLKIDVKGYTKAEEAPLIKATHGAIKSLENLRTVTPKA